MRKATWKRIVAGALSAVCLLSISACKNDQQQVQQTGDGKLFAQTTELSLLTSSNASWPYDENWKVWQYLQEATGAKLTIQAIPDSDFETKLSLMMSSPEKLPDMIHLQDKRIVDQYATDGAFVAIEDHMDEMPDYTKFFDSIPAEEKEDLMNQRRSADGKIYQTPAWGHENAAGLMTWMYRKDIFEQHGLEVPKTMDEIYEVCKKLKAAYPNSYPLSLRDGVAKIDLISPAWKKYFSTKLYYDYEQDRWAYGAAENTMKDIAEYFRKLHAEGLVTPDFITITTKSWEELMSTDRGFISMDYIVRLDYFNVPNRKVNEKYTWAVMEPPVADAQNGYARVTKLNLDPSGFVVCNTGRKENITNAFRVLNWMFTDEAAELLSWGKEGETYEMKDGKKQYILGEDEIVLSKYGIGTPGTYLRMDREAASRANSEETQAQIDAAASYVEDHSNPCRWLALLPEELKRAEELRDAINTYTDEQLAKFFMDMLPMSEWDGFQKNLREMGLEEYIGIYDTAYRRVMNEK